MKRHVAKRHVACLAIRIAWQQSARASGGTQQLGWRREPGGGSQAYLAGPASQGTRLALHPATPPQHPKHEPLVDEMHGSERLLLALFAHEGVSAQGAHGAGRDQGPGTEARRRDQGAGRQLYTRTQAVCNRRTWATPAARAPPAVPPLAAPAPCAVVVALGRALVYRRPRARQPAPAPAPRPRACRAPALHTCPAQAASSFRLLLRLKMDE